MKNSLFPRTFLALLLLLVMTAMAAVLVINAQDQRERGLKVGATTQETLAGRKVELWAVLIGISRYQYGDQNIDGNQISNLKNAADDAQAIYDFLRSDEGGNFRNVTEGGHMILLKDEQATLANVERALSLLKQTKPDDYFVIYIAAHGALIPERSKKSDTTIEVPYFVLYDTDLDNMQGTGMRMDLFRKIVEAIPAKKGLVLSDTCHSAGVQLMGRDPSSTSLRANVRYLEEMGRIGSGVGFISAADQLEQSYELDELNHGVFTYSLLEALRGNADEDQDGIVNFNELVKFLRQEVPRLTDQKQHPHYTTTAIEANYIPLSIVRYADHRDLNSRDHMGEYGTLVLRTPDVDGVEVAIDGSVIGRLSSNGERTVKARMGEHQLSFSKGVLKRELQIMVERDRSKLVEVNLSFSESEEESLVGSTKQQQSVFLPTETTPSKEAKDLFLKGVESFNQQKFKNAIDLFSRALKANNGVYADALVFRGRAEQSLGLKEAALISFQTALQLRPTDFETQTLLAEAKFNAGYNVNEVVEELRNIINRHPNFDFARVVLGDILFWRHDLIGAERQLRRAIIINPLSPPAHMILADVLTYQEAKSKQQEAVAEAERALELFQEVSRKQVSATHGLKWLSISHIIFGGARYVNVAAMAEAHHILAKTLTRVVERDETLTERETYLAKARTHLNESIKLARQSNNQRRLALVLDTSAQHHLLSSRAKEAIVDAELALKTAQSLPDLKDFPDAHYTLYAAYNSLQKFNEAVEHLQKFLSNYDPYLSQEERKIYQEELDRLKRAATANRQKE
ncbi:MAG: caspase family protein [Acidobacteriota bacterium]